jgi:SAM-dependent methyltransferase
MTAAEPLERRLEPHAWGEGSDFWGPRHEYRESLLIRTLRPRLGGGRVLNAGCGAGSMTLRLLEEGRQVTSLDASEPFIRRLAAQVREQHPGVDSPALVGDVCDLPFADREFDAVLCGEVLEHLDDDHAAVSEIARVLRPGGVLVASVPANPLRYDWVDHWAGHRRRYTAEGLHDLVEAGGFEGVEVIAWGFPLTGLYHRVIYERALRRRLKRASPDAGDGARGPSRWLVRIARAALELDTLFLGRRPGYLGFLVTAQRPRDAAPNPPER